MSLTADGDPYDSLKEKLVDGIKRRDPDAIEEALDEIDRKIPREKIPPEEESAFERARALVRKLRKPPSKTKIPE